MDTTAKKRWIRILMRILIGCPVFFVLLIFFIHSSWGQDIIVKKIVSYVSDKTGTKVEIKKFYITFGGNIYLEGLYLEDNKGDTLLYSGSLEANIPLLPIIRGNGITVDKIDWNRLKANIIRKDSLSGFNYDFLINAFASSADNTKTEIKTKPQNTLSLMIKKINFSDFDLTFKDNVNGMEANILLGELELNINNLDWENMRFDIAEAHIKNTSAKYIQSKATISDTETEETLVLPFLTINQFTLENINTDYNSIPDQISVVADIDTFLLKLPKADLGRQEIEIAKLNLHNSDFVVKMASVNEAKAISETKDTIENSEIFFPNWSIVADSISLKNNRIGYSIDDATPQLGKFNLSALAISDFELLVDGLSMSNNTLRLNLESLRLNEASGIAIKSFGLGLHFDRNHLSFSDIKGHINDNILQGMVELGYPSFETLIKTPEAVSIRASLPNFSIAAKDIFIFAPKLKYNQYFALISRDNINGSLNINGTLSEMQIPKATFGWRNTSIEVTGSVKEALNIEKMSFDFPQIVFSTTKNDIAFFVDEQDMDINIPKKIILTAQLKGKPNNLTTDATLATTHGTISLKSNFSNTAAIAFDSEIKVRNLAIGKILKNEQLGMLDFKMKTSGKWNNINDLDATLDATIEHLSFDEYAIENLKITGNLNKGKGYITAAYKDESIDVDLQSSIALDTIASHITANLDMRGIDFKALRLTNDNIRSSFKLHADFEGSTDRFEFSSGISNGMVIKDGRTYTIDDFDINGVVNDHNTSVDIRGGIIQAKLRSNTHFREFTEALKHHFKQQYSEYSHTRKENTLHTPSNLTLQMKIMDNPLISEVFVPTIKHLDTISIDINFDEQKESLLADIEIPHVNYSGNILEGFSLKLNSNRELSDFLFGFKSLNFAPLSIKETVLKGKLIDKNLFIDFSSFYNQQKIIDIQSELVLSEDTVLFHLKPDLILNGKPWKTSEQNSIIYSNKHLIFNNFKLSGDNQALEFSNKSQRTEKDHIEVIFQNFRLSDLSSYLNPEMPLVNGHLNGNVIVEEPFGNLGILASLTISELEAMEVALGNLSLDAKAIDIQNYDFQLTLNGGDIDLNVDGNYSTNPVNPAINIDLALNELKLKAIEKLSGKEIENSEGFISGMFEINGTTDKPQYVGRLDFKDIAFTVKKINAIFKISEQSISLDNKGVYFNKFKIQDKKHNTFMVDGSMFTDDFANPDFDLKINAKSFNVLNSTEQDNDLYYGTINFDVDASVKGNLNLPIVKMRFDLLPTTNITYVMAESDVQMEERNGVVTFVNRDNTDDIPTEQTEGKAYNVSGLDIEALLSIKKDVTFNVIINKQTGDNLNISGEGDLNLTINPNGRINLTGRYEVKDGHFEMNLYNLARRRFEIAKGSSIAWSGDPMDATLDIRAIYRVKTSAIPLMAAQTSGMDASEASRFRQRLPFLVYLNIGGEMTQPELSFNIDMPEEQRGAIGGQVYSRLQQLDSQEDERNRQVFSLLVLNRFFPESGSDGSNGGSMAIARDNLNQALSDQLNNLSDQLLDGTGIELDFGLNSYTNYQGNTPQDRTQLDITAQKKFFDDRLILSIGSEVDIQGSNPKDKANSLIGNVAIEYLIDEDGRYRLKGFRKNQYTNVIDGQIFVNGIAFIFSKEFNKYRELWTKQIKDEDIKETEKE